MKQQEASRQFLSQFTDRMHQKEKLRKEKLAQSWKNPNYDNHHYARNSSMHRSSIIASLPNAKQKTATAHEGGRSMLTGIETRRKSELAALPSVEEDLTPRNPGSKGVADHVADHAALDES